jgi:DNA modification methylase
MTVRILTGDCRTVLRSLPDQSVHCCVTSPPYWGLRDYGVDDQIGLEDSPDAFVGQLVDVFREVRRVLRDDGTVWLNLGYSYAGSGRGGNPTEATSTLEGGQESQRASMVRRARGKGEIGASARNAAVTKPPPHGLKQKDLVGAPWMVAFALRADGWYLRQDIIWSKPNPMPESVTDRCTKAHEYLFLLSKSARYFYDVDAVREPHQNADRKGERRSYSPGSASSHRIDGGHEAQKGSFVGLPLNPRGRNKRSVWTVATSPFSEAHFATFPPALIEPCILAGCPRGGVVLDPFFGAGTTGLVADRLQRDCIGIELNPEYAAMAERRINGDGPMFSDVRNSFGEVPA